MDREAIELEKLSIELNKLKTQWYKKPAMIFAILSFIAAFAGVYGQYLFSSIQAETSKNELILTEIKMSQYEGKETELVASIEEKKGALDKLQKEHDQLLIAIHKLGIVDTQQLKLSDSDKETSNAYKTVVSALDQKGTQWSYVGKFKDGVYIEKYFKTDGIPSIGDSISSLADVFKRDNKPIYSTDSWQMGKIVGLVKAGNEVLVQQVAEIPGVGATKLIWVKGAIE